MSRTGIFTIPSFGHFLRILITAVFLLGFMPAPVMAQTEGAIAGQVTDNASGNPIAGVTIFIFEPDAPSPTWTGNTDNIGIFGLPIPAGAGYGVAARKDGYVTQRADGKNVIADNTTTVNFSLLQGGIIQGTVTDNTSAPIQGASVRAYLPASPGVFFTSLLTNSSGQYSLTAPAGEGYIVEASKQGYISANQTSVTATVDIPITVPLTLLLQQQQPPPPDTIPPTDVTNLTAVNPTENSITLTWTAPGDDSNNGTATQYDIRYAIFNINDTNWSSANTTQAPPAPHIAGYSENFTISALSANTTYYFALKTRDEIPNWSELSNVASATTAPTQPQQPPQPQPGINIAHISGQSAFTLGAGDNTTEIFNITSVNSFAGTVELFFGGAPPGIQANSSLNPSQVTLAAGETRSVTLSLGASADTASGTYFCTLVGQATGIQPRVFGFAVNVGVAGMPLLWASPPVVAAGGQTTFFTCKFAASADITLKWDSGPRVGQTMATGQTSENGTWNSPTMTIPADMPGGSFAVKATTASNSAVFSLTITSGSGPDFLMSASPQFISTTPGGSSNVTITITSVNGFNAPVILTPGSPPGITLSLSTNNVTPSSGQAASATLTISVADWVAPNMYHINVGGACINPSITRMIDISLDIQPLGQWGPGLSLSQSYGVGGDSITITGANFPPSCNGQTVTIVEAVTSATVTTTPSTITVNNGGFTGTFTIPPIAMSGNYRIKAIVASTGDFAERDFQILGAGETFTLGVSPTSVTVTTEEGHNSASVSVNIFSVGGNSPSVNLGIDGAPPWLNYQFGSLPANTPASGDNAISVPAGGSASQNLQLTASLTAPTGNYPITVRGWVNGSPEQRVSLQLSVQPPSGFGMAEFTLSPTFGENGRTVNFSGSGFTNCNPSQVTELRFGGLNILTGQSLPTINVPESGDSAGRFSGSFRVPSVLLPGTYPVEIRVGTAPNDKFINKPFTITGGSDTYVLQASPAFLWVQQGGQIHSTIQVQAVGSSSANVSLSLEGCPIDITTAFASGNVTAPPGGTGSTDLTLTTQSWLPAGHYTITVKGQLAGGAEVHRIPLEIEVAPPAGSNMASIYLSPTSGYPGTWVTLSGSGFPVSSNVTHVYIGLPNAENDWVARLPAIATNESGALSAVMQISANMTPGTYPIEVVVGNPSAERRANAQFTIISSQASFNISVSPTMIQTKPGDTVTVSVNVQSVGSSSANITLRVEGPPNIKWWFDVGTEQTPKIVSPPIGGTIFSSLQIRPDAATPMGHFSLAVKAFTGQQQEYRTLELEVGASDAYNMPIFSLNPNNGMTGTSVTFSGSNFPGSTNVTSITFGGDSITLPQAITTSPQGTFSGAFNVPGTVGGQPIASGTYMVRVNVGPAQSETNFNVYGSDDTFTISLSPNFLQGGPGTESRTSCVLQALGGASPAIKVAVRGLPPGVETNWNGNVRPFFDLSAPPGGQIYFELGLVLPNMIAMGQYPAVLEGWVDSNQNNAWDAGEKIVRVNLQLSVMPPQGYGMGMLSLNPTFGQVGDTITIAGSGFPRNTRVTSLTFAGTDVLTANITTTDDNIGSFSGVFTIPSTSTAFGHDIGPGMYPVDVVVGDRRGNFGFQVISGNQKFSVGVSPNWLARPAGETAFTNVAVRSLVATPPSPTVIMRVEGLPQGVTPSFTSANVTPPFGNMESRELQLIISNGCPMGKYPISIRAYNADNSTEEMVTSFTLEVTPSSGFMDMGMAMVTISPDFGSTGDQITVSGYGFPKSENLTQIRFGPVIVTPAVLTTTDATGAFSALITVPSLPSGPHPVEVNIQNTIRMIPFNIMGVNDTFSLNVSPNWLAPIPAGDPNGRQITITVSGLPGKTPIVSLSTEGLFAAYGTITQTWSPESHSVNVTSAGGAATATLMLIPSENLPPGPYPFNIVAIDGDSNRRDFHMEFHVGPPANFMGGTMGMNQSDWNQQWEGTQFESGVFFPEIMLSPGSGPASTQVTYTGTNLPAGANVTGINFAGRSVPLPPDGVIADSSGGFSGSFIVDGAWNLAPGGTYFVNFHLVNDTWWQDIGKDFNLMRSNAAFSLEATPNWIPPIPPEGYGQTNINVRALGYNSVNVTMGVMEAFGGMGIPGGAQAHWNTNDGPNTTTVTVPSGGQTSASFYLRGFNPGHYMITIVGWIDSNNNQILEPNIPSEAESAFLVPLDFDVQPPQGYKNWDMNAKMNEMGMSDNTNMYLFYFPEIVLNPNMGQVGTKVNINATAFPAGASVTHLRFAGMELPVPAGTAADNNGVFTVVFNIPRTTAWGGETTFGWYDIEIEAQKAGEPPVNIRKPFQVTAADVAFTLRAEPNFLPPLPPGGNGSTLIRVMSVGSAANVTLSVDKIPPGINTIFSSTSCNVSPGGSGSTTLTLTPTTIPPGHYGAEIKGTTGSATFYTHIEFDIQPPQQFMNWNKDNMMSSMNITASDKYLLYFPEIILNPNMGQAGNKVTITATDFPASANVTHLRFAGMELPVPANTTADNITGTFTLVFNVPKSIWSANITSGWYDVQVEAQKLNEPNEPPVSIMKPFQVTAGDIAFTIRAEPGWLPPIPPSGSNTTITVNSLGAGFTINLSVDKIPPGITTVFSSPSCNVSPGGSGSVTLTLTPTTIPPGHYGAEIKGTAIISNTEKIFFAHIEFDVQPATMFKDTSWMEEKGIWFPEITINPSSGPVKTKVTISATDFPAGANITSLRFAGRALPKPDNTTIDSNGNANLVFNVPGDFGVGQYMIEVEAQKAGMPRVFIAKPFFVQDSGVTFKLNVVPGFIAGVPQGSSGNTTIYIESTSQAVAVQLYVDGLPPGVTATFDNTTLTVSPGGSGTTRLTITTRASTPPGQYPLTIRGVNGAETRVMPFGFGVMPPANFQMPKFTLSPDYAPAGYTDKQYKITFSGTGFPANRSVSSLKFGSENVSIPANLVTDANGNFNGVFQMPTGLDPGTYDVRVAVADGSGGYIYDSRPFSIRGADAKFILQLSPPYLPPIVQGGNVTITVNTMSVGTTTANITLYVDGLAPGITAAFSPSNIVTVSPGSSGSAIITLSVSASTPPGPCPVSIRGITGTEAAVVPLGFGVMPNIGAGEGHGTITINPPRARPGEHIGISGAGFTSGNTITLTAAPPGAATPINITPGTIRVQSDGTWATEITVPPAAQVPPGTYIIKAADGVMAAKNTFSIVPAENADFFLNLSPQFLKVTQGFTGNTTLTLSSKNGFKEAVRFSVGHLAPGVTATFQDTLGNTIGRFTGMPGGIREITAPTPLAPIPGEALTITVLIVTDTATPIGPYDIPLEARTSTIARAVPLGLMVVSTGANMVISPSSGPADTDIRLSGSGYTAGETLAITFANNNIATVPATITVAQDGSFTAVITAPSMSAGIYPVKATGSTSGISIDRPFSLKPSAVNNFVLYATPMKVDIPRGSSGTVTAQIEPLGSFQSAVALSVSGLSAISGATASFTPSATITPSIATPTTATLTINVPTGATEGKYPLVITGISGSISQTRTITLNVVPPTNTSDFAISLAPNTIPVSANSSGDTTVSITALNGFTDTVNLAVAMSSANATWPASISYTANSVTPSATTGLGKQTITFTASASAQPGTWTFRVTGTSGALSHSTEVMFICTPSGTTVTTYASPRLDPTTVTSTTPIDMTAPWGDKITINSIINDGAEANVITPASMNVTPETLANLPDGATDMLGRITNVDSSAPVDDVQWDIGFPFDPADLAAAGFGEENLKVAYLNPDTGNWTIVTTTIDTVNKIAYASPSHFSSWTLIATPAPPPSAVVTEYPVSGGGGGGGASGVTSLAEYTTSTGKFVVDATVESVDGKVKVNIPRGTIGKNKNGQRLYSMSIKETPAPAAAPADTRIIGTVYDIGPNGATFDPPVNLIFEYKDSQIPAGFAEESLVIYTWQNGIWTALEGSTVDPSSNTITVPVSHFTDFTIIARAAAASFEIKALTIAPSVTNPDKDVIISVTVTNTGDIAGSQEVTLKVDGSETATQEIDLAGRASQDVSFTLTLDKVGTYTINVNGLTGTLTIKGVTAEKEEAAAPSEVTTTEIETAQPEVTTVPAEVQPTPSEVSEKPAKITPTAPEAPAVPEVKQALPSKNKDWLIFFSIVIAGIIIVGLVYWRTRTGRKTA